jgi:G:T/U-mismatch repair DNA glycosylase
VKLLLSGNVHRSRHALNADTIREMHLAFRRGGRKAIEKVMRNQPAVFLKLLALLWQIFERHRIPKSVFL